MNVGHDRADARYQAAARCRCRCRARSAPRNAASPRASPDGLAEVGRSRHGVPASSARAGSRRRRTGPSRRARSRCRHNRSSTAEGEARCAVDGVDADHRKSRPTSAVISARQRVSGPPGQTTRTRPTQHQGEEFRRAEFQRDARRAAARATTSTTVATVPPMKEPIAAIASAAPARPLLRHLVAVDAGDRGRGFARDVDQHGGDRAAIHRAVIDRRTA